MPKWGRKVNSGGFASGEFAEWQIIIGLMESGTGVPCVRPLICPVCHHPLNLQERSLRCDQNHTFDIAREGYVNLMVGHKRPTIQGDDKVMLAARRRFLSSGRYQPLSEAVNKIVLDYWAETGRGETAVLDIGCGGGYYLGQLRPLLPAGACTFGLDVAKEAARLAAKRCSASRFVVTDVNRYIPFADKSVHILLNIFAPRNPVEFGRIAAPGALLLIIIPASSHLRELREELELLDIEVEKRRRILDQLAGRFVLQKIQSLAIDLNLTQPDLTDLVQMTPNYWHLTPGKRAKLEALAQFQTAACFEIMSFLRDDMSVSSTP